MALVLTVSRPIFVKCTGNNMIGPWEMKLQLPVIQTKERLVAIKVMTDDTMEQETEQEPVHIMRTVDMDTGKYIWVIFDRTKVLYGKPKDTKTQMMARWSLRHYRPDNGWVEYEGIARASEFAVTVAEYQNEKEWKREGQDDGN